MTKSSYFFMKFSMLKVLVVPYRLIYILCVYLPMKFFSGSGYRRSLVEKCPLTEHYFFVLILYMLIVLFIRILNQFRLWKNMLPIKSYEKNCVLVSDETKNTGFTIFRLTFYRNDIFLPKFICLVKILCWFRIYIDIRTKFSLENFRMKIIDFSNYMTGHPFLAIF
jgi:hypothetical protein